LPAATSPAPGFGSFGLAGFAPFWLVLETFVGEEHLFAGSEYKLGATLRTFQDLIVEFHDPLPLDPSRAGWTGSSFTMGLD
jgi:hypothetical protein